MKIFKIVAMIIVILGALSFTAYFFGIKPHFDRLNQVAEMSIGKINPGAMPDGAYQGEFCYSRSKIQVTVTIADGEITEIDIFANRESDYIKAASGITDQIMSAQSLQVDVVSGATRSSKAILKAVEMALQPEQDLN